MTRDALADAIQRLHSEELANTTLEIYSPTEAYTAGEGFSATYPDEPDTTVPARVETPSGEAERDRGGTTSDADATIRVLDEPGFDEGEYGADGFGTLAYTEYGEDGEAPARLRDVSTDTMYELRHWESAHNGLLLIEAAEL